MADLIREPQTLVDTFLNALSMTLAIGARPGLAEKAGLRRSFQAVPLLGASQILSKCVRLSSHLFSQP